MRLIQIRILVIISVCLTTCFSLALAQSGGDLSVSGATITNDLAIMALDCTANTNGGALTTDADGIVVCSDDDGDTDTTLSESEVDAFVANNGYSTGPHTVDTDTTLTKSDVVDIVAKSGFSTGPHTVDTDTTYNAGTALSLSGGTFNVSVGAGNGLDADLLDGQHANAIIAAANSEMRTPFPAYLSLFLNLALIT